MMALIDGALLGIQETNKKGLLEGDAGLMIYH